MADSEQKTYRIKATCNNCGDAGTAYEIQIGTEVKDQKCSRCGCAGHLYRVGDDEPQPLADVTRPGFLRG